MQHFFLGVVVAFDMNGKLGPLTRIVCAYLSIYSSLDQDVTMKTTAAHFHFWMQMWSTALTPVSTLCSRIHIYIHSLYKTVEGNKRIGKQIQKNRVSFGCTQIITGTKSKSVLNFTVPRGRGLFTPCSYQRNLWNYYLHMHRFWSE